jgi:acyl carrier protein
MPDLLARLTRIIQDVFEDDSLVVTEKTTSADVPGWDSLMHVRLMLSVERAFNIRFKTAEVAGLKNVGELALLVSRHAPPALPKCA